MKLPEKSEHSTTDENASGPITARLVARLDSMIVLREVYGVAAEEIAAVVDSRLAELAAEGLRLRRVNDGVYVMAAPTDTEDLERIVTRLQSSVGGEMIQTSAGPAAATLSVGVVAGAPMARQGLLRRAGAEAASASSRGPGGRSIAKPYDARGDAIATARAVLGALNENRLALAYQPILRADRTSIVAFDECLARLLEPSGRIVVAGAFMPAMEELRLTRPVDRRVLEIALSELAIHPTLRLSVNLSAQSLGDPGWLRILEESEVAAPGLAARLIVEITESAVIGDEPHAYAFVAAIRRHGCAIALDDFGAGYSAFRHIKQLRPDILKIDGSFVEGVGRDPDNRALIESIMVVARHFEMLTVAERVNAPEDSNALRELGIDCFQGYFYGQPTIEPDWRIEDRIDLAAN